MRACLTMYNTYYTLTSGGGSSLVLRIGPKSSLFDALRLRLPPKKEVMSMLGRRSLLLLLLLLLSLLLT